ncbi:Protein unc-45-like protein A [Bienertia sinuspersici]
MVIRVSKVRTRWMFVVPTILVRPNQKKGSR